MRVLWLDHREARRLQQLLRRLRHFLAVLERACRVIAHPKFRRGGGLQAKLDHEFGDVAGKTGDGRGILGQRIAFEHVAIVLHGRPTPGGVDDDRVEPVAPMLGHPGPDVGGGGGMAEVFLAHVMGECPATADAVRDHHIAAMPGQEADRGRVDVVVERPLRAACHQGDTLSPWPLGGMHLRIVMARRRGNSGRREIDHRAQLAGDQAPEGLGQFGARQGQPEPAGIGQDLRQQPAQRAVMPGARIGFLDVSAGVIDEMHVVHTRRTGRHAREAGETPVDVLDRLGIGRPLVLQHVLDEVNPSPRAVEFVAKHLIGRTGRRAEPAMHAGAQDLVGARRPRIGQLSLCEIGLHQDLRRRVIACGPGSGCPWGQTWP